MLIGRGAITKKGGNHKKGVMIRKGGANKKGGDDRRGVTIIPLPT